MQIVYATDGSEGAKIAGQCIAKWFGQGESGQNSHVHVVSVRTLLDTINGTNAHLDIAREALQGFPGEITTATVYGDSTSEIVDVLIKAAQEIKADLLVAGAKGHSALTRFMVGSVAEGLTRFAPVPVLLVRGSADVPTDVVFGVDGSFDSTYALRLALRSLPFPSTSAFHFVQAITPVAYVAYPPVGAGFPDTAVFPYDQEAEKKQAHTRLQALASETGTSHPVQVHTPVGNAPQELEQAARECNAGLVVVGSRGLTGLNRLLLGSVASHVVHHAPCSVLVVKSPPLPEK